MLSIREKNMLIASQSAANPRPASGRTQPYRLHEPQQVIHSCVCVCVYACVVFVCVCAVMDALTQMYKQRQACLGVCATHNGIIDYKKAALHLIKHHSCGGTVEGWFMQEIAISCDRWTLSLALPILPRIARTWCADGRAEGASWMLTRPC